VETVVHLLARVLMVLFAIGVIGCLMVIPATAAALVKAMLEPDAPEEGVPNPEPPSRVTA
jgi:hypothetical protein